MARIPELACTFARQIDRFRGATWNGNESRIVERVSLLLQGNHPCPFLRGPCSPSFLFLPRFRNTPVPRGHNFANRGIIELCLFTIRNAEIIVTLSAACEIPEISFPSPCTVNGQNFAARVKNNVASMIYCSNNFNE